MFSRKPEKVSPKIEGEHTLKVKLPEGSTARSKKLIAKQKQAAASAVGRLKCYHNLCLLTPPPPHPPNQGRARPAKSNVVQAPRARSHSIVTQKTSKRLLAV